MTPHSFGSLWLEEALIGLALLRQLAVLWGTFKSIRFLRSNLGTVPRGGLSFVSFCIVLPLLREASRIGEAIDHFGRLVKGHIAKLILVTTEREAAEAAKFPGAPDTVAMVRALEQYVRFTHLHYPNPSGVKADQLNFAVDHCAKAPWAKASQRTLILIYDADSRPPLDSLVYFESAAFSHPDVMVFHQSSRFTLPQRAQKKSTLRSWIMLGLADSGALRANRFVLGYELPRLINRSPNTFWVTSLMSSYVYTHVTGHGLCVDLELLRELPFPSGSPLEDMHFSFLIDSRNLHIVPVSTLDCAEVPESLSEQFRQMTRWVIGPARFVRYLSDPATKRGWRSRLLAASAAGITLEWISCSFMLPLLALLMASNLPCRIEGSLLIVVYTTQLCVTDWAIGTGSPFFQRLLRLLLYPVTFTAFGIAGVVGSLRLLRGGTGIGKTERS